MRVGNNPESLKKVDPLAGFHRVVIPLYIPNESDEYFQQAWPIFEICLNSVIKTSYSPIKVSVVSNGSCPEVNGRLSKLQQIGKIDELIIETEGIGKINSVLKVLRTAEERLITITDADVLFRDGWEEAVLEVFQSVPRAGSVCPVPVFRKEFTLTANIWMRYLFSNKLRYRKVKNPEAMTRFANSIGWPFLAEKYKDVHATLELPGGGYAAVGCSHFVATYKKEVFEEMPAGNSQFKIRGNSEYLYMDLPVLKRGGYRLSTADNYAYHMGNRLEPWIQQAYEGLEDKTPKNKEIPELTYLSPSKWNRHWVDKVFVFLLSKRRFKRILLRKKGMSKKQITQYLS